MVKTLIAECKEYIEKNDDEISEALKAAFDKYYTVAKFWWAMREDNDLKEIVDKVDEWYGETHSFPINAEG